MSTQDAKLAAMTASRRPQTMAALKAQMLADPGIDDAKKKMISWALGRVPRAFGLTAETMPATARAVASRLPGFQPAMAGLTKGTWSNALHWVRVAMVRAGIMTAVAPGEKFSPAWKALLALPAKKTDRIGLSRLARFGTDHGIDPEEVDDAVFDRLLADMMTNAIVKSPAKLHRKAAVLWNNHVSTTRNWPNQIVAVPSYSRVYAFSWSRFEPSLVAEIEAHLERISGKKILDKLNCRPLKPGSIKTRRHQLGAYLSGLVLSGENIADLKCLADVVDPKRVRKGLYFLLDRNGGASKAQAHGTVRLLLSIARHEVEAPPDDIVMLQGFRKQLDELSPGMTPKNKSRLRQFDDDENVRRLLSLPASILGSIKNKGGPITEAVALRAQSALAIEILLMIPMRRENLTRLNILKHIDRRRNGDVFIIVPSGEVKNGVDIEAVLPPESARQLDEYMRIYQPVLAEKGSPWIFPGLPGRPKSRERLSMQVSETIKKEIGLEVHMHLFRHIAAKIYLDRHPGAYAVVQRLCGHKSINTTMRSYCGLEVRSAIAHYDKQILELRADPSPNSVNGGGKSKRRVR